MTLILMLLELYEFLIIVRVVLSWVPHNNRHKAAILLRDVTNPVMVPLRRIIPNLGGIDFSPILIIIGIEFLKSFVASMAHGF